MTEVVGHTVLGIAVASVWLGQSRCVVGGIVEMEMKKFDERHGIAVDALSMRLGSGKF